MLKIVPVMDPSSLHSTDIAIKLKLEYKPAEFAVKETKVDKILRLRRHAQQFPEVREDGRIANYDYQGVKRWYDAEGRDEENFYADGESATPGGFNRDGWQLDQSPITHRMKAYDRDGYDAKGYDREGYNRAGFNRQGINRRGFNQNGIHTITGTDRDADGYNIYDVDEHGRLRTGEFHPAVVVAYELLGNPSNDMQKLAKQHHVVRQEIYRQVELAKAMVPHLEEQIRQHNAEGVSHRMRGIHSDLGKVRREEWTWEEFWGKHPKIDLNLVLRCDDNHALRNMLCEQLIHQFDPHSPDSIHRAGKLLGITDAKKLLEAINLLIQQASHQPVEAKRQLASLKQYLASSNRRRTEDLIGMAYGLPDSNIMRKISAQDVDAATALIRQQNGVVTYRTVLRAIVNAAA